MAWPVSWCVVTPPSLGFNAEERLIALSLLEHGSDPGQVVAGQPPKQHGALVDTIEGVDEPELSTDIEKVAKNQITSRIAPQRGRPA